MHHKEKPTRITAHQVNDEPMVAQETTQTQTQAHTSAMLALQPALPSSSVASLPSPSAARPPVVSRTHVLSFVPRSVRAHTLQSAASLPPPPPQAALPSSAAFTRVRDFTADDAMHDDAEEESEESKHHASESEEEDDAAAVGGSAASGEMDVDVQSGVSRLHVEKRTLPRKMTFGSMHRRHG